MSLPSDEEIARAIVQTEWERDGDRHPDILIHGWNRVRLTLSTHSEGGITQGDVDMARRPDRLVDG